MSDYLFTFEEGR